MSGLRDLEPWLYPYADYLLAVASYWGGSPRVTSVYRSPAKQARLYRRYLAGLSSLPAAPPGRSMHQYRRAFDLVTTSPAVQVALGELWRSWGGVWGREKDPVHFEA